MVEHRLAKARVASSNLVFRSSRRRLAALAACALTFAVAASPAKARRHHPARATPAPIVRRGPARPTCATVVASLLGTVDTKRVRPGDRFAFKTITQTFYRGRWVPPGTLGSGFIETMERARSGGRTGWMILDAQYLQLRGGFVPVAFAPGFEGDSTAYVGAGKSDAPGALGFTPLIALTTAYNVFHHGKDAALVSGTRMLLVVGTGLATGACALEPIP